MTDIITLAGSLQYRFEALLDHFPAVQSLKGVGQNPEWHGEGDVFVHTRNVCNAVTELPEWQQLNSEQRAILWLAAYFHDLGKLTCSREEDGVIVSPKHAVTGARIFRELVYKTYAGEVEFPNRIREKVASLIRFHGLPQLFMEKEPIDFYLLKARESTDFKLLYLLAKADVLGRECRDRDSLLAVTDYFAEYTRELGCYQTKPEFGNEFTRWKYFRGAGVWRQDTLYDSTEFPVYIMAGLPLSGKDTYIEQNLPGLPVVSLDRIREEWGIGPEKNSAGVAAEAKERAKVYLRQKEPFVWNATNIIAETRFKLYRMCEAYGARVILIYLEVPYRMLLERNDARERYVPLPVLKQMVKKLEYPDVTETYRVEYDVKDVC